MRAARLFAYSTMLMAGTAGAAGAQASTTSLTGADSVFLRAKQLVLNGNGAAGRLLVDSVVAASTPDTPAYAEALYWRATLAAESADAERDFRRIVVEYPLSRHANDALLQLGQSEAARGDRPAAAAHLERYLLENPQSPDRAKIGLQVVRLAFDVNDAYHGCTTLGRVMKDVPSDAVEMRNQLAYYSPRCAGVDTLHAPGTAMPDSVPTAAPPTAAPPTRPPTRPRPGNATPRDTSAAPHSTKAAGKYTLQVAAYTSRSEAEALARKLKSRGLEARVTGTSKLFRVRIGRYLSHAEAAAAAKTLKAKKITAFVTEVGADDR
jgi:cell division septation protein DedD